MSATSQSARFDNLACNPDTGSRPERRMPARRQPATVSRTSSLPTRPSIRQRHTRAAPMWRRTLGISHSPTCRPTARCMRPSRRRPDSSINVRVWLPTPRYNGRYLGTGNGGYAGGFFFSELADGINRGFATANTDMGDRRRGRERRRHDRPSGKVEGLRLARHPPDDDLLQGAHQRVLRRPGAALVFRRLLDRRTAGADGSATLSLTTTTGFSRARPPSTAPTSTPCLLRSTAQRTRTPTSYIPPTKLDVVNQAVLAQCRGRDGGAPTDPSSPIRAPASSIPQRSPARPAPTD